MTEPSRNEVSYAVAGYKPWNRRVFDEVIAAYPGRWHYFGSRDELTVDALDRIAPRYVFFVHWSWKVPVEIVDRFECVCFHMADLPYGRGGSPLQNLIVRGHRQTKLTALQMTDQFDAGPIYLKRDLCLEGSAEEIYIRAARLAADMIGQIIRDAPRPSPQSGEAVVFRRRTPRESEIPQLDGLESLFDHLRMLDAEGYPPAFLLHKGFRYEFHRSALHDGRIEASVTITPDKNNHGKDTAP